MHGSSLSPQLRFHFKKRTWIELNWSQSCRRVHSSCFYFAFYPMEKHGKIKVDNKRWCRQNLCKARSSPEAPHIFRDDKTLTALEILFACTSSISKPLFYISQDEKNLTGRRETPFPSFLAPSLTSQDFSFVSERVGTGLDVDVAFTSLLYTWEEERRGISRRGGRKVLPVKPYWHPYLKSRPTWKSPSFIVNDLFAIQNCIAQLNTQLADLSVSNNKSYKFFLVVNQDYYY